ncbi:MAG: hypothetical protein ACJ78Q_04830 [Chloroflexia bacterium]
MSEAGVFGTGEAVGSEPARLNSGTIAADTTSTMISNSVNPA